MSTEFQQAAERRIQASPVTQQNSAVATQSPKELGAVEAALVQGDITRLNTQERITYYKTLCESLGLNPITRPFEYVTQKGKLSLYCKKDAAEQLRKLHNVSIQILDRSFHDGVYIVRTQAKMPNGRLDEAIGAISVQSLKGEELANALMKGETKAKRRVTLSICGLGFLDETEVADMKGAVFVTEAELADSEHKRMLEQEQAGKTATQTPSQPKPQETKTENQKPNQQNAIEAEVLPQTETKQETVEPPKPSPSETPKQEVHTVNPYLVINRQQQVRLFAIAKERGWSHEQIKEALVSMFPHLSSTSQLNNSQYNQFCGYMENSTFEDTIKTFKKPAAVMNKETNPEDVPF